MNPSDSQNLGPGFLEGVPVPGGARRRVGDYEILEVIARGGMGVVYKARQCSLNRVVALKMLLGGIEADEDYRRRFQKEAELVARLSHPNIVPIYDIGQQDGQPFFSMEYVAGTDLAKKAQSQPLRPEDSVRYVEAVAWAVHYAHEQGVLHRDLKPSNILLGADDRPRITDFGLARQLDAESSLTVTGAVLGSPGYLPPEQLSAGRGVIGPASDVYGLGAILYHLLTGRPPFMASTLADTLRQLLDTEPVSPRLLNLAVSPGLEAICLKCLRKSPRERFPTAAELAQALQTVFEPADEAPKPVRKPDTTQIHIPAEVQEQVWGEPTMPRESHLGSWIASILLLVVVVAGVYWFVKGRVGSSDPQTTNSIKGPEVKTEPSNSISPPFQAETNSFHGALLLRISQNSQYAESVVSFSISNINFGTNLFFVPAPNNFQMLVEVPAGTYELSATVRTRPPWSLQVPPVVVETNTTNVVAFSFVYGAVSLASEPSGADISWPSTAYNLNERDGTHVRAPATNRFRSGAIPFTARIRGYYDTQATNYFFPANGLGVHPFLLKLRRRPVPYPAAPWWTNSLGMVFRWVEPQKLWVCVTETRVKDFRSFVTSPNAHYSPSPQMFSVTSKGWKQAGYSWENPGPAFSQTEDSPVIGVNWQDAADFCEWLTRRERALGGLLEDQTYRLPGTNEWWALAGGHPFPWGSHRVPYGNYAGVEVIGQDWPECWPVLADHQDRFARTAPVYSPEFKPNELGFYHLGGNAAEWCREKILLGGSWFDGETGDFEHLGTLPPLRELNEPVNSLERHDRNGFRVFLEDPAARMESP
jgi:serine/threonine protein kinase